ncbi:MAG TPA: type II toxin-antitoxin system PemK/MazF family toxin [Acetobacteraceae bacterium]|nr:type II toxin-antitoxin system PemK/MazF family toxin [Acetobacteraceae bacterium]
MEVRRGELIAVAFSGDYGKPRPALVVQADAFGALPSVTVLPLTSELHDEHLVRITVEPTSRNGLRRASQIMVDKVSTVSRSRIGARIGRADAATMEAVGHALAGYLGLG